MVLKRKKSLKNICKTIVRPGLVLSGGGGDRDLSSSGVPSSDPDVLLAPLTISSRRSSAITDADVWVE